MARDSRVKKSILNAKVNLICYFASLLVAFFTRKIFLDQLGAEFIGLTGTLQSLLGFLNLAELGVGSAISYVLYKPIFDDDKGKINEIISVFGYLYRCIGLFILSAGIVMSIFLPWIFPNTTFSWFVIYLGFYAYLSSSMLGYFVNYQQVLLSADQRNYEVTGFYQAVSSTKIVVQIVLALYFSSFVLYLLIELVFGLIYSYILTRRIKKVYPWLQSDTKSGKSLFKNYSEIGEYVKQLFIHKIGGFVQMQITPFLIYSFVSLPIVAIYGNYTLIVYRIQGFIAGVLDSTSAGIGNLISEGNRDKIYSTFKELFSVRFLICGILASCIYKQATSFIEIWLGVEYALQDVVVLLISMQFFLMSLRGTTDQFLYGYGLFYDVWAPLVESGIFVAAAIVGGSMFGLPGVLCGPILSLLIIVHIWKPFFLFKKGLELPFIQYIRLAFFYSMLIFGSYFLANQTFFFIFDQTYLPTGWFQWIIGSCIFFILMTVYSFFLFYTTTRHLRRFIRHFINAKNMCSKGQG